MGMNVVKRNGTVESLQIEKIHKAVEWACEELNVSQSELETETNLMLFDGIKTEDIHNALIKAASTLITVESPDYTFVAARLLLQKLYKEVTGGSIKYPTLESYIEKAIEAKRVDPRLLSLFNLERLDGAIDQSRDLLFTYLGLQTVADRYLITEERKVVDSSKILELPQHMWMRVAMGLALEEDEPTDRAIEFYNVLSGMKFISSTPTLFNSGTLHSQMSSCYLNTVSDEIGELGKDTGIFNAMVECANLSKYAGGIGTDWNRVRPEGDVIRSTNGKSSGIVPYLKVFNDTAVAVNQGGKRVGSFAAYIEPWHPDLYDFCDLKKNSGDERRRAHDIFPALWMPDLFFKRVEEGGIWSFFSPAEYPDLHELYGEAFEARYTELEAAGACRKQLPATDVWKKILTSLYETGHPWITYKDECNRRNPQAHVGVIHGSNLCTEITLNTSDDETAVCNLGSVNLARIYDAVDLQRTIQTGIRMLDNVIDLNFYPSAKARFSNLMHRPVGMGVMGYTEWLVQRGIDWESEEHLFAVDGLFELISYFAIEASCDLSTERGAYPSFKGSKWSKGILPIDTARDGGIEDVRSMDWRRLRNKVMKRGMRNSNLMAIAPTATISNIAGTTACIEPPYKRSYTKSNLSGSFLIVDPTLRYNRPHLCKEAFEIAPEWVIKAAAVRQRWIDQSQSVNVFVTADITGQQLAKIYMDGWKAGLKTTYYLRNQAVEMKEAKVCSILDKGCKSCE